MSTRKTNGGTVAVIGTLIGPSIPGAYMAITGHTPHWARIWYLVWLALGALFIIARAGRTDGR